MAKKPILFLYISISSGHQRAAEAIMGALRHQNPAIESIGIDSFTHAYPIMGRLVGRAYLEILRHTPQMWNYLYDNPDVEEATRELREIFNFVNSFNLNRLIKRFHPSCLVCTQAAPLAVISAYKRRGKLHIPVVGVITDFAIHKYWISNEIDLYLASTEEAKQALIRYGIRESRIHVTGIPIDLRFARHGDPVEERHQLGMDPKLPVILIMGGSQGMGPTEDVVEALRNAHVPFQIIVVCGKNKRTLEDLRWKFNSNKQIRLFGYTKNIHKLMDTADVIITKPGGLTSAEALAKGIPMIMIRPLPGQEERNAHYLLKHKVAERVNTLDELTNVVHNIFSHRTQLQKLKEHAYAIAKPHAASEAARIILNLIEEKT